MTHQGDLDQQNQKEVERIFQNKTKLIQPGVLKAIEKVLKKTLRPLSMDVVQLPQGQSHFEETVYFLPPIRQKFPVIISLTSEEWKAEFSLEPPNGFEHGIPGLGI